MITKEKLEELQLDFDNAVSTADFVKLINLTEEWLLHLIEFALAAIDGDDCWCGPMRLMHGHSKRCIAMRRALGIEEEK